MENVENMIENKTKIRVGLLVLGCLIIAIGVCAYYLATGIFLPDNIKFSKEYTKVEKDNIFKYATKTEILSAFDDESAIIFFGFPACKWCQGYVTTLNDLAKESGIKKIYYYNIKKDREKNTDFYKTIVAKVEEYLSEDDEGNPRIYVPDTYFIKNGKIVGHNDDVEKVEDIQILLLNITNCDDSRGC